LIFLALGCTASLAGALYPALPEPRAAAGAGAEIGFAQRSPTNDAQRVRRLLPVLLALAALALTQLPPLFDLPLAGYTAIALVLVIGIASAPLLTQNGCLADSPGAVCRRRNGSPSRMSRRHR
jgi:putative ABC transport system permease protein